MLTPNFEIRQTDDHVTFIIKAPYADLEAFDVSIDECTFIFYCSPYYLRLTLPGPIEETESSKGRYDADSGTFDLTVNKLNKGQHFPDLDLITSLLAPRKSENKLSKPIIEVVDTSTEEVDKNEDDSDGEIEDDCDDWLVEQNPLPEPPDDILIHGPQYGFANKTTAAFYNFSVEFSDVIELPSPDTTPSAQRALLRNQKENDDFSEDHYLADWAEDFVITPFLEYKAVWEFLKPEEVTFSEEERSILKDLPNKEYLLDSKEKSLILLSLVDILFGYAYNVRTTLGEDNVESAWTVNKLSSTLSWLQSFNTLQAVVTSCVRRSLTYPLYRHWDLSAKVIKDICNILNLGKRQVLKCLLQIRNLFNNSEPRYILNQLYVNDYCVWIQQTSDKKLLKLADSLSRVQLKKEDVQLDLLELEVAARSILEEDEARKRAKNNADILTKAVSTLKIQDNESETSSATDSDSEDSSSSSDSSDSESDSDSDSDSSESGESSESPATDSDDASSEDGEKQR